MFFKLNLLEKFHYKKWFFLFDHYENLMQCYGAEILIPKLYVVYY